LEIKIRHPPEPQTVYLEPSEIDRLEQAAEVGTKRSSILHLRDQAAFALLDETEIEISVLLSLQINDYDSKQQTLQIGPINALLNAGMCQLLNEYLTARGIQQNRNLRKTEYLFASFTGKKWSHKYTRQAVNHHRQNIGLSSLQPGQSTYPSNWPSEEQKLFIQTPVHPYDRSIINSKLILGLGLHCGLRAGEMIGVKIGHVDLHQNRLYVNGETAKGRKSRFIPLNSYMVTLLEPHLHSRTHGDPLLVRKEKSPLSYKCLYRMVKTLAQNAGITYKKVTPHTLRHSFATNLKNQGVSIHTIKNLLGHSSVSETERYLHTGEKEMEVAVEKLVG
jgi:site-specific recombinase XerD